MSPPSADRPSHADDDFPFLQTVPDPPGPPEARLSIRPWLWTPPLAAAIGAPLCFWGALNDQNEVALAGLLAVIVGLISWRFTARWGRRVLLEVLRDKIAARPDRLLDPRAKEAFRVRLLGDREWSPDFGAEDGFCLVDEPGRRLLYEGDRRRWDIPEAAIATCAVRQTLSSRVERDRNRAYDFFVVCIELADGPVRRTLPLQVLEWNAQDPPFPLTSQKGAGWLTDRVRAITNPVNSVDL